MSTIGELERMAGIGSSAEERTAFWIRFHHLDGVACLKAGVAELERLVAEKEVRPVARRPCRGREAKGCRP
ncbi:hypothetical protein QN224_30125 [Sinorhizobium sp. 8-89]|uniref:hypothetical protein n=1 Tax=Sinorhizobium sp. 7-81 TaxID=3049087 RepID=UPI0024C296CD|nr:hypothetical protein [Sinorhizobium sp. 7-81]MDK1389636.1 hypothetical protein [Sinorhizobium sp. 7-81]